MLQDFAFDVAEGYCGFENLFVSSVTYTIFSVHLSLFVTVDLK